MNGLILPLTVERTFITVFLLAGGWFMTIGDPIITTRAFKRYCDCSLGTWGQVWIRLHLQFPGSYPDWAQHNFLINLTSFLTLIYDDLWFEKLIAIKRNAFFNKLSKNISGKWFVTESRIRWGLTSGWGWQALSRRRPPQKWATNRSWRLPPMIIW